MVSGGLFHYVFAGEESMWWKLPAPWWYHENVGKGSFLSRPSSPSSYGEYLPTALGFTVDTGVLVSLSMTARVAVKEERMVISFSFLLWYRILQFNSWPRICFADQVDLKLVVVFCSYWVAGIIGMNYHTQPGSFIKEIEMTVGILNGRIVSWTVMTFSKLVRSSLHTV